jgi:hypothetical protein
VRGVVADHLHRAATVRERAELRRRPWILRRAEQNLDPLAGRDHDLILLDPRAEEPAVGADPQEAVVRDVQCVKARGRRVDDTKATHFTGAHRECRRALPVDEDDVAFAPVHLVHVRRREHLRLRVELVVAQHHERVGERTRERIFRGAHANRAREPHRDLMRGLAVRMRVVPVRPRAARGNVELVVVRRTGRDRIARIAVLLRRDVQAVPVHRRRLGEVVREVDDDVIAFGEVHRRTGDGAVVRVYVRRGVGHEREVCWRRAESDLDGPRFRRSVRRDRRLRERVRRRPRVDGGSRRR